MYSRTEENYLKCIYVLSEHHETVSTNAIADKLQNSAASVTDMVKKLAAKDLVEHIPYRGIKLRDDGRNEAIFLLRKHRLWECFLHNELGFSWDELHDIAEELEHIRSTSLIDRLDAYLGFPKFDPHGEPIPDKNGFSVKHKSIALIEAPLNKNLIVMSVLDESDLLLYLTELKIGIGTNLKINKKVKYDGSLIISTSELNQTTVGQKVAEGIFVQIT